MNRAPPGLIHARKQPGRGLPHYHNPRLSHVPRTCTRRRASLKGSGPLSGPGHVLPLFFFLFFLLSLCLFQLPARAANCSLPSGSAPEGAVLYNTDHHVMQYCNGTNWMRMGPVPGAGGTGCAAPSGPTSGLVGWWKLDDGSGSTAADSSGNGNTGTLTNGPTWTTGKINGALSFDINHQGLQASVDAGDPASLQITGSLTMTAWIYMTYVNPNDGDDDIIDKHDWTTPASGYQLKGSQDCTGANNGDNLLLAIVNSGTYVERCSNTVLQTNKWYFVVGIYDASAQTMDVYINGSLDDGTLLNGPVPSSFSNTTANFAIGGSIITGAYFHGKIDDPRIYNRALSAAEVKDLYDSTGGPEADLKYSADYRALLYCDGTNWVLVGNPSVPTNGLVGWWKFDEGGGSTAADSSGQGNDGTLNGSPLPTWTTGQINGALSFDGTSQYVSSTNSSSLEIYNSPITVAFWMKMNNTATSQIAVLKPYEYTVCVGGGNISLHDTYGNGLGTSVSLSSGTWYHVAMVFDGTSTIYTYLNGSLVGTPGISGTWSATADTSNLTIAKGDGILGCSANYFDGTIDDVRIYNRALSATEVAQLYDYGLPHEGCDNVSSGLVGWWKLDDGSGTTAADSSGNSNTGTTQNSPTWTTGKINGALQFTSANQYVSIPDTAALNMSGSWTVSAWVNPSTIPASGTRATVLDRDDSSSNTNYLIGIDNNQSCTGLNWRLKFDASAGGGGINCYPMTITANTWYFITGVYDSPSQTLSLYVNGALQVANVGSNVPTSNSGTNLVLGNVSSLGQQFYGTIDDVRIYNRAVSTSEVNQLYHMGSPEGAIKYNAYYHVLQYCNGTNWVSAGPVITPPAPVDGLIGWWKFDEGSGSTAADSSAYGYDATLSGGTSWTSGKSGDALTLDGISGRAQTNADIIMSATASISFWAKTTTSTGDLGVISFGPQWFCQTDSSNQGKMQCDDYGNGDATVVSNNPINDGAWHHFVFTAAPTSESLYVDGTLDATLANTQGPIPTGPVDFGSGYGGTYFPGSIDDVRIYNRILSSTEVQALYNNPGAP